MTPDLAPRESLTQQTNRRRLVVAVGILGVILSGVIFLTPSGEQRKLERQQQFATARRPVLGNPKSGGEVVVFLDYSCTACKAFEQQMPAIQTKLIDAGKMHLTVLHSPFINESSKRAAGAAECIYRQSNAAFWTYTAALYAQQGPEDQDWATPALLHRTAATLPINLSRWEQCVSSGTGDAAVQRDLQQHRQAGMIGTPAVFVNGFRTPAGGQEILSALRQHPASIPQP